MRHLEHRDREIYFCVSGTLQMDADQHIFCIRARGRHFCSFSAAEVKEVSSSADIFLRNGQ